MENKILFIWALLFLYCEVINADAGSRRSLKSFQKCLRMPYTKASSRRKILNHIRSNFAIIPLSHSTRPHNSARPHDLDALVVPRRVPRTLIPGGYCPYTIKSEDVPDRMPRFLSYASCREEICNPAFCKPVMYSHKILIKKCDEVWEWSEKTLPVAFVRVF